MLADNKIGISNVVDYTSYEKEGRFLEGTGSMIFDHCQRIAYAALSERTDKELFLRFCKDFGFNPVYFYANQTVGNKRLPIYHTNVMMSIADQYVVICLDAIDHVGEREMLIRSITSGNKEIIAISEEQMHHFAGNMLQVNNTKGERLLVMSRTAFQSLHAKQIERLTAYHEILSIDIPTVETYGGGGVRCMMAEVFTPTMKRNA